MKSGWLRSGTEKGEPVEAMANRPTSKRPQILKKATRIPQACFTFSTPSATCFSIDHSLRCSAVREFGEVILLRDFEILVQSPPPADAGNHEAGENFSASHVAIEKSINAGIDSPMETLVGD